MALKIRLRQQGRRNLAVYRLVLTDVRAPRDGKYLELLGHYDPNRKEHVIQLEVERIRQLLGEGAILTDKATQLVKQVAPELLVEVRQKALALRAKVCAKRRTARKNKEIVAA